MHVSYHNSHTNKFQRKHPLPPLSHRKNPTAVYACVRKEEDYIQQGSIDMRWGHLSLFVSFRRVLTVYSVQQ